MGKQAGSRLGLQVPSLHFEITFCGILGTPLKAISIKQDVINDQRKYILICQPTFKPDIAAIEALSTV